MRYLLLHIIVLFLVGTLHAQTVTEVSSEYDITPSKSISTLEIEGRLINPAPPPLKFKGAELVEVGYGTINEMLFTGSITTFSRADFKHTGYMNVQEFLQGRVPGLRVTKTGYNDYSMQIRGVNSLMLNTEPLVVIDGTPMTSPDVLNTINPQDIKNLSVLKGPEAAIYGVRGSNGVIIINTY